MGRALGWWAAFWAGFALLDMKVKHPLSGVTRWFFRTHTKRGAIAFTGVFVAGALALWRHIIFGGD